VRTLNNVRFKLSLLIYTENFGVFILHTCCTLLSQKVYMSLMFKVALSESNQIFDFIQVVLDICLVISNVKYDDYTLSYDYV